MTAPMPIARKLGQLLKAKPIPELEPIRTKPVALSLNGVWPAHIEEEIRRILADEETIVAQERARG